MFPNPFHDIEGGQTVQALGYEITLVRRSVGELMLPSGRLVACDPLVGPETEPFAQRVPAGRHGVFIVVAELRDQVRIAFAGVQFAPGPATRWELATVEGEQPNWRNAQRSGYHVESAVSCFVDASGADIIIDMHHYVDEEEEFARRMARELRRKRKGSQGSYGDLVLDPRTGTNLIVFEADPGTYTTYMGYDDDGRLIMAVTDFQVLDYQFTPYGLSY